jgi:CubicO group peptidase (beta-lactamase class C family)
MCYSPIFHAASPSAAKGVLVDRRGDARSRRAVRRADGTRGVRAVTRAIDSARGLLTRAIHDRIFPAAAAEVGDSGGRMWHEAFGSLTFDSDASPADTDTIFDLASLTKPIATTTMILELATEGALAIDEPLAELFDEWRGEDRETATIRDVLEHSAGLAARLVDQPPAARREFIHDICSMRLEYKPRERSLYSDLGFILLAFVIEDRRGMPLRSAFDRLMNRLEDNARGAEPVHDAQTLAFGVPSRLRTRVAPTWPLDEDRRRGRMLIGEVHDNYAAALGGAAGHTGLFGSAAAVGRFARLMLRAARGDERTPSPLTPSVVAEMTRKSAVPNSSRALGWDTMLPTSSCGVKMSPSAFGQVGFTGTSLWIDPALDRYFVLLTNRACRGGTLDQMREVRRAFHDSLARPE